MDVPNTWRIALLGKTGAGKSSLANTLFGENVFKVKHLPGSEASVCQAKSRSVGGRNLTLIDTPGFFAQGSSEEELKAEIVRCVTAWPPGPHAFLIVLKLEKFTEQENDVITQMKRYFSPEALKYATVVFTHGDQLSEEMTVEQFVRKNKHLKDLVEKCGGRCHVVDNKYWKNKQQDEHRSNGFQVAELLNTIEKMVMENKGGCFTTEMLEEWEKQEGSAKPLWLSLNRIFKVLVKYMMKTSVLAVAVMLGLLFMSNLNDQAAAAQEAETHTFL